MSLRAAIVDLDAIRHNVAVIRDRVGVPVMAVVKADAYGHGAVPVARAAVEAGADRLGVADLGEALALRAAGIDAPLLAWVHGIDVDMDAAVAAGIELGVSTEAQLTRAAAAGAIVHLKTDTGLSRNGFADADLDAALERAAGLERSTGLRVAGVFSHLANAGDDADAAQRDAFAAQLERVQATGLAPEVAHLASTAGALAHPDCRFDLVRIGIGLYGLSPWSDDRPLGLRPAMRLESEVIAVRRAVAGTGVSYGHTYRADGDRTLALVGIGYADGVPRSASNAARVTIRGREHPIAGRVAMDQFVVDVGDADVDTGDTVVLFGDPAEGHPSADRFADAAGTINYEIVTRVGGRVERRYVGDGASGASGGTGGAA